MEKDTILANVSHLTAEQLFEEIKNGKVTLVELKNTQELDFAKRKKIIELLDTLEVEEGKVWDKVHNSRSKLLIIEFISNYPNGKHVEAAKDLIKRLEEEDHEADRQKRVILDNLRRDPNYYFQDEVLGFLNSGVIRKNEVREIIIDKIKKNNNIFSPEIIIKYLKNYVIDNSDLIECGIPFDVIERLDDINDGSFELGQPPSSIPDGYTEVYFWGNPGSGKTTALAAMLSTAHRAGFLNIAVGPGYDYTTRLKSVFADDIGLLPAPSPIEVTQYLPFALKKPSENYARSVSLIELSGEIFQCFYYKNAGKELPTQTHQDTFDSLYRFLKGKNRKVHFFFIDYDMGNKKDKFGLRQTDYLEAASTYFKNNAVFGDSTDAIYVVVTKCDLMLCPPSEYISHAKTYLEEANYSSFMNTLKDNCKKYSINAGSLTIEPFSLGKIYFKRLCAFDSRYADKIMNILFERIKSNRKSILDIFNK